MFTSSKYSFEMADKVGMLLAANKTPQEIQYLLAGQLPYDPNFNAFCTRLRNGLAFKQIADKYGLKPLYTNFEEGFIISVCELLIQNKSTQEIAMILGVPMDTRISNLCSNLKRRNIIYKKYTDMFPNIPYAETRNCTEITMEQMEEIFKLKKEGHNVTEIANLLESSNPNINRTKIYGLISRIKKNPNAKGRDLAIKYGIIKE